MIYVCIPAHEEAETIGLVLWKIRRVFGEFGREYQLLVADDASRDNTAEILRRYTNVLPLTVETNAEPLGYARTVESLTRMALERTDRPKRDCAILMHADFTHGPEFLPDMIRRIDSGADLVVAETGEVQGQPSRTIRAVRRWAPLLVKRSVRVPGVRDLVSGFLAVRLSCLRLAFRESQQLLATDGWAANVELIARLARQARRIETVSVTERHDRGHQAGSVQPLRVVRELLKARPALRATASAS
jgi:dolichol-phosphate mannosyltransferase